MMRLLEPLALAGQPDGAALAGALRAIQHEVDALLLLQGERLAGRDAYVLGRAVEGLTLTARLNAAAAVVESGLRRLVRSVPDGMMSVELERAVLAALALCVDALPQAVAPAAGERAPADARRRAGPTLPAGG